MNVRSLLTVAAAIAIGASPVSAQTSVSTDDTWQSCKVLLSGSVPCTLGGGTVEVGPSLPGGWQPGPWIRPAGGNPLTPNNVGGAENPTWQYGFGFQFNSDGARAVTMNITRMQIDNYFRQSSASTGSAALNAAGFYINGTAISFASTDWLTSPGYNGVPSNPNGQNWQKVFGIDLTFNAQNGLNTFEVRTTGNGVNDGFAMEGRYTLGQRFDVPEPASFALIGFGLVGLGAAARRRRTISA